MSGAGRVSKIGTRSIKIVRLIRLFRLVKLYKSVLLNQKKREKERLKRTSMRKRIDSKTMPRPSNIVIRNIDNPIINHDQANQSPNNQNNLPKRSSVFNQNKRKSRNSNVNMNNVSFVSNLSHKWYLNNNKPETKGSFHSYSGSPQKSLKSPTNLFNNSPLNNFSYIKDLERDSNVESVNTKEMSLNELQNDPNKKESAVGKRLSELTTKRVIILVLLLILFVPLFDSGSYFDPNPSYIYGLITLSSLNKNDTFISKFCDYYIDLETHNENKPLIILKSHFIGTKCENFIAYDPFLLREDEKDSYIVSLSENENLLAIVDITYYTKMNSIFNILRTLFVGTLLTIATLLFHKDANTLVLKPIERMIEKVFLI